jgi:hypothetical protein
VDSFIFPVVAVVLYFVSDALLQAVEIRLGRRLEHRTLVFFAILSVLALVCFAVIRRFLGP